MPGQDHYQASPGSQPVNLQARPDAVRETPGDYLRQPSTLGSSDSNTKAEALEGSILETPTGSQPSLPLQWIDEQELRQNKSGLRKTVRSYARRDTCLRQQRRNAASRPTLKTPRNLLEKKSPKHKLLLPSQTVEGESQDSCSHGEQHPWTHTTTLEASRVPQNVTETRSKSEATDLDTPPENDLVIHTAKEQCKYSVIRHHIRSVPACRWRRRRSDERSLPETSTHETPSQFHSSLIQDNIKVQHVALTIQQSPIFSIDSKNVLCAGSWRSDIFDSFAPIKNLRACLLLNHYQEAIGSTWRPSVNRAFLNWNLSSEVLLHGLLYFAASHRYVLTNELTLKFDVLHHKGEVLRLINESLDNTVLRTSDPIIGALSYMVICEEMFGSKEAAAFHRKGLRRLLHLRNSVTGPELNYFIIQMLPITGVQYTSPKVDQVLTPVIDRTSQSTIQRDDIEPEVIAVKFDIPSNVIYEVFVWLKNSARLAFNLAPDASNRKQEPYLIRTKIEGYLENLSAIEHVPQRDYYRYVLTASLIYIHTITATMNELATLHETERDLVKQLRQALADFFVSHERMDYSYPVLIWALLLGRLHSRAMDAAWFQEAIIDACAATKLERWVDMKRLLKELPWVQEYVEVKLRAFCPFDENYDDT